MVRFKYIVQYKSYVYKPLYIPHMHFTSVEKNNVQLMKKEIYEFISLCKNQES